MITDVNFKFDATPKNLAVGVADQISTNVYDAGSAKKVFEGYPPNPIKAAVGYVITAGTGVLSFRARFVSADNAALTTNPIILADTGVQTLSDAGAALAIGNSLYFAMPVQGQKVAKQYYGFFFTQGTADQDGEVTAILTEGPQTMHPVRKAAVP